MAHKKAPVYYLHWNDIDPGPRVREKPSVGDFPQKLEQEGLMHPITYRIIERDGKKVKELVGGFRRWSSCAMLEAAGSSIGAKLPEDDPRRLPPGTIMAQDLGEMDEIQKLMLEMSENESRKGFSDAERSLGYAKLRKLLEERDGKSVSVSALAAIVGESIGQVGMGLKVAEAVDKGHRELLDKPSVKAAYQQLQSTKKLEELKKRAIIANAKNPQERPDIDHSDGLTFLKGLEDESVDLFNFDPPWGIGVDGMVRSREKYDVFSDGNHVWEDFTLPALEELYRVLKQDTWGIVWFGIQYYQLMAGSLLAAGFKIDPVPCIWYKSNKTGSANDPDRHLLNVYEPFLIVKKGDPRMFKKAQSNVLTFPMDRFDEREHYAQKPVELMVELLERYSFGQMFVIDPCYGSGRIFGAAKRLGRRFAGAEQSEPDRERAHNFLLRG